MSAGTSARWFVPYVDVTLTPTYAFQSPAATPVNGVFLAFIVAQPSSACTPSWGGYYTLDEADSELNLHARIAQVQSEGGHPMISFGGQANTELAVSCTSVLALTAAYLAPVQRYGVSVIDLDIEGATLANRAANARRADAIAAAQRHETQQGHHLGVWLTLPVAPDGLTADGEQTIEAMLHAHVALAGVNVMAMDFGSSPSIARNMIGTVQGALAATHGQVSSLYRTAGLQYSAASIWHQLGVTVMIGQNDVPSERFTVDDARQLAVFAAHHRLARVSAWWINRDSECGSVFAQIGELSNTCSGVRQTALQFTQILDQLPGTETARAPAAVQSAAIYVQQAPADNPTTSPYPIWQPTATYLTGYKVVWHRQIYQTKWFSQGSAPDTPVQAGGVSPWLLIGPVPAGQRAPKPVLLASAKQPVWSATVVYRLGARVIDAGLPYAAKWYTKGDQPSATLPADPQSPWQPLFTLPGEPNATGAAAN